MPEKYKILRSETLQTPVAYYRRDIEEARVVTPDSPALDVMTDLRYVRAVTIPPSTVIDQALQRMIHAEVRMLLVVDAEHCVVGIITARDILSEKPVHYSSQHRVPREEILVEHIMTPRDQIQVLHLEAVMQANVGDIILTLREVCRQHALVMDKDRHGRPLIRGIFSTTQIGRQLGVEIQPTGRVQSFAELEALLNQ